MRQIIAEGIARCAVREIAALFSPAHDGIHHAANQLPHRALALRAAGFPVKIFAGYNVGSRLRPTLRNFNTVLAENGHAFFVTNQRGALLPFHGVKRGHLPAGEVALEHQSLAGGASRIRARLCLRRFTVQCLLHRCHLSSYRLTASSSKKAPVAPAPLLPAEGNSLGSVDNSAPIPEHPGAHGFQRCRKMFRS